MSYADRMEREYERMVADASRCPIASALEQEAEEAAVFCFDERRHLLLCAVVVCRIARHEGRDLRLDGLETALDIAQVLRFAREA